jgi:hypothetical protein
VQTRVGFSDIEIAEMFINYSQQVGSEVAAFEV